jgi:hypothetical protein
MEANSRTCRAKDADGRYPLHWATWLAAPPEVVGFILKAYPRAKFVKDRRGLLPFKSRGTQR